MKPQGGGTAIRVGIADKSGALKPGMPADITVLDISDTQLSFTDQYGGSIQGNKLFVPLLTMIDGRVVYRQIFF